MKMGKALSVLEAGKGLALELGHPEAGSILYTL